MDRANKLVCPHCGAPLKSVRGIRVGRQITCPKCATAFTVRPEDVGPAGGVDGERLALVVCGVVLYLLGGAALAGYCFWLNARKPEPPAADQGPRSSARTLPSAQRGHSGRRGAKLDISSIH